MIGGFDAPSGMWFGGSEGRLTIQRQMDYNKPWI